MPMVAVYTASKMAIEGFTASLAFELEPFHVQVKLVEPGYGPSTRFTSNGGPRMQGLIPEAYAPFAGPGGRWSIGGAGRGRQALSAAGDIGRAARASARIDSDRTVGGARATRTSA